MDTVTLELIVIILLIGLNGFFSMAEFAIISIRKGRIAQLVADGDERAEIIEQFQKDPHPLLAVIQIGVTVAGSAASTVGGIIAIEHLRPTLLSLPWPILQKTAEPLAALTVVIIVSYVSLIIGELVPKAIGLQYADKVALSLARPMQIIARITAPAVLLLTSSSRAVQHLIGLRGEQDAFITREEVQHMVLEGHETGVFSESENEYIRNVFEFTHTYVREVMVPRTRMVALELQMSRDELVRIILEAQYSRYPVYHTDIEEIVGVLHDKDIMAALVKGEELNLEQIIRPPVFVPEGKKVNELLKEMQRTRNHMALVVDEYGGISGLVTTEDLLEELVGEIEDEHDAGEPVKLVQQPDGSWLVDGLTSIFDLQEPLGIKLEEAPLYETVAGLVLNELGHLPLQGETVDWNGFRLVCEQVTRTAILQVRISVLQPDISLPQPGTDGP
ncbi:HlyC/CorC family transporter [Trichlorobacter lovleyi]|uniref:hemolysin family protein n=1 Tax=Trichlorobacter lovleyi TaxID=313985 RepID=UPI0022407BDA|nr:hemolysin family protein [Trichlorobacter lovleyi]QOX79580.1 HlyC/CorC family transporter [Trichlorobacter lovleyi]